jgi:hypothetical protein
MKHSDPVDTTAGPATSPSSSSVSSHMNGGAAVPPNETLLNALRLHHLSVVRQDEARRRRGGGFLATTPPSSSPSPRRSQIDYDDDIYSSSMSWLSSPSSPSIGFSPRHSQHHPGASPPASMNGLWGGPSAGFRRESAALQDTRRRHLLGILTAALDELSDGSLEMDPLDGEADDLDDE